MTVRSWALGDWRPTTKKLPRRGVPVIAWRLVDGMDRFAVAWIDQEEWQKRPYWTSRDAAFDGKAANDPRIRWMPLPRAPQDDMQSCQPQH